MEINDKLNVEIEAFKRGIEKRNPKEFTKLNTGIGKDSIEAAVFLAYNDAKRTMTNINEGDNEKKKKEAIKNIETELSNYFTSKLAHEFDEKAFDEEHKKLCKKWWEKFNSGNLGTYGKAQKIINMSFKYLYCCNDASNYKKHFEYCHMPLDSFTLEWFKRKFKEDVNNIKWYKNEEKYNGKPRIKSENMASWSALEYDGEGKPKEKTENDLDDDTYGYYPISGKKWYYSYRFYLENIRNYIERHNYPLSPLELEFIVWPEIQKEQAAEGFLSVLKDDLFIHGRLLEEDPLSKKSKNTIKQMTLDEKYRCISKLLSEKYLIERD